MTMDTNLAYDVTGRMNSVANQKKEAIYIDQLDLNTYVIGTNDRLVKTKIAENLMVVLLGRFIFYNHNFFLNFTRKKVYF